MKTLMVIAFGLVSCVVASPRAIASAPSLNKSPLKVTGLDFAFSGNVVAELEQGSEQKFVTFARNFAMEDKPPPEPGKLNVSLRDARSGSSGRWLPPNAKQTRLLISLLAQRLTVTSDNLEKRRIATMQEWLRNRDSRLPKRHEGKKFGITWMGDS